MINAKSKGKQKKAAIKFIEFLLSRDIQKSLAMETGKLPALKELYNDVDIIKKLPFLSESTNPELRKLFTDNLKGVVLRPSSFTNENYTLISSTYFNEVYQLLKSKRENVKEAVNDLSEKIQRNINNFQVDKS